jgi:hypothetical protein
MRERPGINSKGQAAQVQWAGKTPWYQTGYSSTLDDRKLIQAEVIHASVIAIKRGVYQLRPIKNAIKRTREMLNTI